MGCIFPKKNPKSPITDSISCNVNNNEKHYSWSNRNVEDGTRFIIANEIDSSTVRLPSEIDGQQFTIQNCKQAIICLFDHSNTIMVDDCIDCTFFIGPVKGSIAVRNCDDCRFMSASQQFRIRDCKRVDLFLYCETQPAIESCSQLQFGCFSANYNGLEEQFMKAGLNMFNNKWFLVYDFSFDDQEIHWKPFPIGTNALDHFQATQLVGKPLVDLNFDARFSLIPQTMGFFSMEQLNYPFSNIETNNAYQNKHMEKPRQVLIFIYSNFGSQIHCHVKKLIWKLSDNIKQDQITLLMAKSYKQNEIDFNLSKIVKDESFLSNVKSLNSNDGLLLILFYQTDENGFSMLSNLCEEIFAATSSNSNHMRYKIVKDVQNDADLVTIFQLV